MTNLIDKLDALRDGKNGPDERGRYGLEWDQQIDHHWPAIARVLRAAGKLPIKKSKSGWYFLDFARNGEEADAVWQLGEALDALKEEE